MRKKGFTISEALVILGVIGTVAMLTMPTFIANQRKLMYSRTLQMAITNFNKAMGTLIVREGADDLLQTEVWTALNGSLNRTRTATIRRRFALDVGSVLAVEEVSNAVFNGYTDLSGNAVNVGNPFRILTKNGVEYKIEVFANNPQPFSTTEEALRANTNYVNRAAVVFIDINGENSPNIYGRDLFRFDLSSNGVLCPFGGYDYNTYHNIQALDPETQCKGGNAAYCAAYLMDNDYNMDY